MTSSLVHRIAYLRRGPGNRFELDLVGTAGHERGQPFLPRGLSQAGSACVTRFIAISRSDFDEAPDSGGRNAAFLTLSGHDVSLPSVQFSSRKEYILGIFIGASMRKPPEEG